MPEQAVVSDCTHGVARCNEHMFSSLRCNPRHCDSIDFLNSVASDFGSSFLGLVTLTSTLSPHTVTCLDASVFHYLSDVASWMTAHTPGKNARTRLSEPMPFERTHAFTSSRD